MTTNLNSPTLRFKSVRDEEYPEWEDYSLKSLGSTYSGLSGKNKEDFGSGEKFVQYLQVYENSQIDFENCGLVNIVEGDKQHRVKQGDILFTLSSETRDEVGISSVVLEEPGVLYLNSFCFGFRLSSQILSPFFARYLFRSHRFRREMYRLSQGSTRFNLSKNALMKLVLSVPHLFEQQRIANFLSSIDTHIEQLEKKKSLLERYKKGMMQKLFSQEIRFKNNQEEEFPEWKLTRMKNIAKMISGVTFNKGEATSYSERGRIPVLRAGNIGTVLDLNSNLIWIKRELVAKKQLLQIADIVICMSSGSNLLVGKNAPLTVSWEGTVGAFCSIIRCESTGYEPAFLAYFLRAPKFRTWTQQAYGSNIKNLNRNELEHYSVPLPELIEQQKISKFLFSIDQKIDLITKQIERTREFKKGLLQQMFV